MTEHRKAEFIEELCEEPGLISNKIVTKCWCGWETTARNSTMYGTPGELNHALIAHRVTHIEKAVFDG